MINTSNQRGSAAPWAPTGAEGGARASGAAPGAAGRAGYASADGSPRPFGRLFTDIRDDALEMVRLEFRLFRVEMQESAANVIRHGLKLAVGGVVLLMAANALIMTVMVGLVLLLNLVLPIEAALVIGPLIVAAALGITGWVLVQRGKTCMQQTKIWPSRTVAAAKETTQWITPGP